MRTVTLFLILTLPPGGFAQNKTIKVKKSCALCGTWIYTSPPDSMHNNQVTRGKFIFEKNGGFILYENVNNKTPKTGEWRLESDSLVLFGKEIKTETGSRVAMKIDLKDDVLIVGTGKGSLTFIRKKDHRE